MIALAFVGEKEKGLILLQRPTNSGTELAEADLLFLAFAEKKRISGVGLIGPEKVVTRAVPRISAGLQREAGHGTWFPSVFRLRVLLRAEFLNRVDRQQ